MRDADAAVKEVLIQRDLQLSADPMQAAIDGATFIAGHFRQHEEDQRVCVGGSDDVWSAHVCCR